MRSVVGRLGDGYRMAALLIFKGTAATSIDYHVMIDHVSSKTQLRAMILQYLREAAEILGVPPHLLGLVTIESTSSPDGPAFANPDRAILIGCMLRLITEAELAPRAWIDPGAPPDTTLAAHTGAASQNLATVREAGISAVLEDHTWSFELGECQARGGGVMWNGLHKNCTAIASAALDRGEADETGPQPPLSARLLHRKAVRALNSLEPSIGAALAAFVLTAGHDGARDHVRDVVRMVTQEQRAHRQKAAHDAAKLALERTGPDKLQ